MRLALQSGVNKLRYNCVLFLIIALLACTVLVLWNSKTSRIHALRARECSAFGSRFRSVSVASLSRTLNPQARVLVTGAATHLGAAVVKFAIEELHFDVRFRFRFCLSLLIDVCVRLLLSI